MHKGGDGFVVGSRRAKRGERLYKSAILMCYVHAHRSLALHHWWKRTVMVASRLWMGRDCVIERLHAI